MYAAVLDGELIACRKCQSACQADVLMDRIGVMQWPAATHLLSSVSDSVIELGR